MESMNFYHLGTMGKLSHLSDVSPKDGDPSEALRVGVKASGPRATSQHVVEAHAQGLPSGRGQWAEGPAEPGAPLPQCSTRLFLLAFSGRHHLDCWSGNGGGRLWVLWGSYSFFAAPVPYLSLVTVPPGPALRPAFPCGHSLLSLVGCLLSPWSPAEVPPAGRSGLFMFSSLNRRSPS